MTKLQKVILAIGIICLLVYAAFDFGLVDKFKGKKTANYTATTVFNSSDSEEQQYEKAATFSEDKSVTNISIDEWTGYKALIDANGGLETAKGSIFDQLGLKIKFSIINDATVSSNALIKGQVDGAGYTVNRYAFLANKFKEAGVETVMPYIVNCSTGGDGIIAKKDITRIEDLKGKKIGLPRFSESQVMTTWLLNNSSLTKADVKEILDNAVLFDTPDDCAKAFFSGELDAAGTWQPYLAQAETMSNSHLLFSTKDAKTIVLSGVIFNKQFVDSNPEFIEKFIEGTIKSKELYKSDARFIKASMPMFSTMTDDEIFETCNDAEILSAKDNVDYLGKNGQARILFTDMANIWGQLGEADNSAFVNSVFDDTFVKKVYSNSPDEKVIETKVTDEQKSTAKENNSALLSKNLSINFETNGAAISEDSYAALNEFANAAKLLDSTVIQIEGNTDNTGDDSINIPLSEKRASSIAKYLQAQGVDPSRFIIVGNGSTKPIADNSTEEGKNANRRTDIYFKQVAA